MASVSVEGYSFWYPQTDTPALHEVSFSLEEGEWGLLAGPTGSGKTTLLRSLKPEVAPAGKREKRGPRGHKSAPGGILCKRENSKQGGQR